MSAADDSCATSQPSSILLSTGYSAVTHFAFQLFTETEGMYQPSRHFPETQLLSHAKNSPIISTEAKFSKPWSR